VGGLNVGRCPELITGAVGRCRAVEALGEAAGAVRLPGMRGGGHDWRSLQASMLKRRSRGDSARSSGN
jgi:hypothetical protein